MTIDDVKKGNTLVCGVRLSPSLLASLMAFYHKRLGITYNTRGEAIVKLLQIQMEYIHDAFGAEIIERGVAEEYLHVQTGSLYNSKRAVQLLLKGDPNTHAHTPEERAQKLLGMSLDDVEKMMADIEAEQDANGHKG